LNKRCLIAQELISQSKDATVLPRNYYIPLAALCVSPNKNCSLLQEQQRPPVYNPEDYAMSLRKWGRRTGGGAQLYGPGSHVEAEFPDLAHKNKNLPSLNAQHLQQPSPGHSNKDYRNPILTPTTPQGEEMSLRQFSSVTELLGKLKADLRLAFPR
jgi:hypothetical protein